MEKIDLVYLTRALKNLRLVLADLRRVTTNEHDAQRVRVEIEELVKRIARIVAKEL